MIRALVFVLALILAGCSSAPQTESRSAAEPEPTPAPAVVAATHEPVLIPALSDEREVWDCQKCGMEYDRAGMCAMCNVELVHTKVDYSCAADGKPVERAGKCPRCDVPVVIKKTALTAALESPALGGK